MAKHHNPEEENNSIDNLNEHLTSAGRYVEEKKKTLFWVVGAIVVAAVFVISYLFIYRNPRQNKTMEEYANVELNAANDTAAAKSYAKIADKGSGDGANLAALDAAQRYYSIKNYKEALKYLDKFDTNEDVMMANALILKGDCYVNLKQYDNALSTFEKAISVSGQNPQIAPRAMAKMAVIYDEQKKYDKALEVYEKIQQEYPDFRYGTGVEGYAARERARLGK